jgi:chromosome segregation ATPase
MEGWIMPRSPVGWLSEQMRTGLRELPSNAAWMVSRAFRPAGTVSSATESAARSARDRGRRVQAAVVDATPVGGDSVDARMKRARDAAERAREAEEQSLEAARESKDRAEHARQVSEHGRARMRETERDTSREVRQQVAAAQKEADESVKHARREAEEEAAAERGEVQAEIDDEVEQADQEAEDAQRRAEESVADATEKLAMAKRFADEAADAARGVAEEARQRAQSLVDEAEQQTSDADARIAEAEQLRTRSEATAKHAARELAHDPTNGGLESYKKPELIELAASVGVEGRTSMNKDELIDAIAKASRAKR